ncbi:hypothetical protein RvY_05180 [Ramazzottius varieornatus]|uniref:Uncharacterized protein n=1 Tax=Ramazzottius varieornatus TaxID=947166 RepID=A0A1D1V0W5_RAMVA|nr:hypothetical protein RvY_05180 [Ramazzottius varieornatus]
MLAFFIRSTVLSYTIACWPCSVNYAFRITCLIWFLPHFGIERSCKSTKASRRFCDFVNFSQHTTRQHSKYTKKTSDEMHTGFQTINVCSNKLTSPKAIPKISVTQVKITSTP